jgi:hypothetical protein
VRLKPAIQILLQVTNVPGFITYIQAFATKALILQKCMRLSHDSHKKIRFYYCDTDTARNASTVLQIREHVRHENWWHAPQCLIFILREFYFEYKQHVTVVLDFRSYPSYVQELRDKDLS